MASVKRRIEKVLCPLKLKKLRKRSAAKGENEKENCVMEGALQAQLQYRIKNLPSDHAIQKVYLDAEFLYVLQRRGEDTLMSRCTLRRDVAVCRDFMVLKDFGHGQTLEKYQHGDQSYFWITCNADQKEKMKWGTEIGRLVYQPGRELSYKNIPRLSHMNCANKSGRSFGAMKRVDAALSEDGKILFFWMKNRENEIQYSFYRAEALNVILDQKKFSVQKDISCRENLVKSACYGSMIQKGDHRVLPHGSCQGLGISRDFSVYIAGGAAGDTPQIAKLSGDKLQNPSVCLFPISHANFNTTHTEIEGMQLKGKEIYFGISDKSSEDRACLYSVCREKIDRCGG